MLALLRSNLGFGELSELQDGVSSGINWDRFHKMVHFHRLVGPCLKAIQDDKLLGRFVSALELDSLKSTFHSQVMLQMRCVGVLLEVLDSFNASGVDCLVHKGPVLSLRLFGSLGIRHFKDLDLHVPREDCERAELCLRELGFQEVRELYFRERLALKHQNFPGQHITFVRDGICVELHWRFADLGGTEFSSFRDFYARKDEVVVGGRQINVICMRDNVRLLTSHGTKHCWGRLKWLYDLAVMQNSFASAFEGDEQCPKLKWERDALLGYCFPRGSASPASDVKVRSLIHSARKNWDVPNHRSPSVLISLTRLANSRRRGRSLARICFMKIVYRVYFVLWLCKKITRG